MASNVQNNSSSPRFQDEFTTPKARYEESCRRVRALIEETSPKVSYDKAGYEESCRRVEEMSKEIGREDWLQGVRDAYQAAKGFRAVVISTPSSLSSSSSEPVENSDSTTKKCTYVYDATLRDQLDNNFDTFIEALREEGRSEMYCNAFIEFYAEAKQKLQIDEFLIEEKSSCSIL